MVDTSGWRARANRPVRGRRVVVGVLPPRSATLAAGLTAITDELLEAGASDVLVLVGAVPGEEPPWPAGDRCVRVQVPRPTSLCAVARDEQRLLADPPPDVRRAVTAFDPDRQAVWLGHAFLTRERVLGREVVGHRPHAWAMLEDKAYADALFDAAGVRRAPSVVVPSRAEYLGVAARQLDAGAGTVWSGASGGDVHGGAEYVRRVSTPEQARAAARLLAGCRRVRVAPFLEGRVCSIHGLVMPDGVVAARPVELVMLRRERTGEFVYAGMSTWWDPPDADREEMRRAVRRVGGHLRAGVGYRGAFGIDGVLTDDGFVPTELNTRATVALSMVAEAGDVPVAAVQRALLDGHDPGVCAADLERLLVEPADAHRRGWVRAFMVTSEPVGDADLPVAGGPDRLRVAVGDRQDVGVLERRTASVGGLVRWRPRPDVLRVGEPLSAWAPAVLALADRELGTAFGALTAPSTVR